MPRAPKVQPVQPAAGHSDAKWFIIIGVLLALFAGSVVLLFKSPQARKIFVPAPAPTTEQAAEPGATTEAATAELPEGGSVELVNLFEDGPDTITDQKIVWRTADKPDVMLVESVNTLLRLSGGSLTVFAKPTADARVYFGLGCRGDCDTIGSTKRLFAFDPKLRSFVPLFNVPGEDLFPQQLSQNQHRVTFLRGIDEDGETRELWFYDLTKDEQTKVVALPVSESLTSAITELGSVPVTNITWDDPTIITYKVYRAGGKIPTDPLKARTEIATRTVKIEP